MERQVLQDVRVFSVTEEDDRLLVDVYGGAENVCGSINFTFQDDVERRAKLRILDRWAKGATEVTVVTSGTTVTVMDERALLRRSGLAGI